MTDQELEQQVIEAAAGRSWCINRSKWFFGHSGEMRLGVTISIFKDAVAASCWQAEDETNAIAWHKMLDLMTAPEPATAGSPDNHDQDQDPAPADLDGSEAAQEQMERQHDADREAAEAANYDDGMPF